MSLRERFANLQSRRRERASGDPATWGKNIIVFGEKKKGITFEEAYEDKEWVLHLLSHPGRAKTSGQEEFLKYVEAQISIEEEFELVAPKAKPEAPSQENEDSACPPIVTLAHVQQMGLRVHDMIVELQEMQAVVKDMEMKLASS